MKLIYIFVAVIATLPMMSAAAAPQRQIKSSAATIEGQPVIPDNALLTQLVGGLGNTDASTEIVPVIGASFTKALHVAIRKTSADTNVTQLTIPITTAVAKGDTLLATFSIRGEATDSQRPGQVQFLFEKIIDPWTNSARQGASTRKDPKQWKVVTAIFTSAEDYKPGEAMASLRLAFGPQTVEIGGLSVVDFGKSVSMDAMLNQAAAMTSLGMVHVSVNRSDEEQTIAGFGGNFCQPRYGSKEAMDAVGRYNLAHLNVVQARIGIPLNNWVPARGDYHDDSQAHACFLQMQEMSRHKIPIIGTVWEGPAWMLGGQPEQSGRVLPPEKYSDCIDAVAQFLVTARDKYGVTVDDFSFNEPDWGVNFKFTPSTMADFIRQAGPRFAKLGLKTKFLVGDTTGGQPFVEYARPLLADRTITPYLGPLAFHAWDALGTSDARYTEIAEFAKASHKPLWCTEAGHNSALWQQPDPWGTWDNALRTAEAYIKTLRFTGANTMDYWTYQDNYPIVTRDGMHPYPVFDVIKDLGDALQPGSKVIATTVDSDDLYVLAATGPKPSQFSLIITNQSGNGQANFNGLPPRARVIISTRTAAGKTTSKAIITPAGALIVTLPPRSITTIAGSPI